MSIFKHFYSVLNTDRSDDVVNKKRNRIDVGGHKNGRHEKKGGGEIMK